MQTAIDMLMDTYGLTSQLEQYNVHRNLPSLQLCYCGGKHNHPSQAPGKQNDREHCQQQKLHFSSYFLAEQNLNP